MTTTIRSPATRPPHPATTDPATQTVAQRLAILDAGSVAPKRLGAFEGYVRAQRGEAVSGFAGRAPRGPSFAETMKAQYGIGADGHINDFLKLNNEGHLCVGGKTGEVDLQHAYEQHRAICREQGMSPGPLIVRYMPLVSEQAELFRDACNAARQATDYPNEVGGVYATKANFSPDVVKRARSGALLGQETSAAAEVVLLRKQFVNGSYPKGPVVYANGYKDESYLKAVMALRDAGFEDIVPILDDVRELDHYIWSDKPFKLGVRSRLAGDHDGKHRGNDRFGVLNDEVEFIAARLEGTSHTLNVYHAMVGTQIESEEGFVAALRPSIEEFVRLKKTYPSFDTFNFGGGVPTSGYSFDFSFDYEKFLGLLMTEMKNACGADVPPPKIVGELGRFISGKHSTLLFEVKQTKISRDEKPHWYVVNGSFMNDYPCVVRVNQQIAVVPTDHWDEEAIEVTLGGGATCDSDDFVGGGKRPSIQLPATGPGLVIALPNQGAYQDMQNGGWDGVNHCLEPKAAVLTVDVGADGGLTYDYRPQQTFDQIHHALGYRD